MPWRRFRALVNGLLAADTRLTSHLRALHDDDSDDSEGEVNDGG